MDPTCLTCGGELIDGLNTDFCSDVCAGTYSILHRFARDTAEEIGGTFSAGVRVMMEDPASVCRDAGAGLSRERVVTWCRTMLGNGVWS